MSRVGRAVEQTTRDADLETAVLEFQRYLGDELAPLMVQESVEWLLRRPPELTARAVLGWVEAQDRGPAAANGIAGYLYHAVKKLHLFSEFDLVEPRVLESFLSAVSRLVVQACPDHERAALRVRLSRLGETETTLSAPVNLLHRERGSAEEEAELAERENDPDETEEQHESASAAPVGPSRRMTALMDRLRTSPDDAPAEAPAGQVDDAEPGERITVRKELIAQLLSTAALESKSQTEFDAFVAELRSQGIVAELGEVFRTLGRTVPGWAVASAEGAETAHTSRPIEAMRRIVAMSENRTEGTERFGELVYAAIEQFNEGHLAQAVSMFDLALTLQDGGSVDPELAKTLRGRAQSSISLKSMRRFSTNPDKHGLLRRVLDFFPAFTPSGLLGRLEGEAKRDNRKLMLSLIEVHGAPCRDAVLDRLADVAGDGARDEPGFYARNLVWLLRRIPPRDAERLEEEFTLLCRLIEPGRPAILVKETLGAIGALPHPDAERTLLRALADLEETLDDPAGSPYSTDDGWDLLDRACAALARVGSVDAIRTLVHHAFRRSPGHGPTIARLDHLATRDLSSDPEQLGHLVEAVRAALPSRMLGMMMRRRNDDLLHLVRALSGTHSPLVVDVLRDVAARFADDEIGEVARAAVARAGSRPAAAGEGAAGEDAAEDLSGDLELFGLPNLFQSLAESRLSGELTVRDRHGNARSRVVFVEGLVRAGETGPLRGESAVYQLFVRPEPGTFSFRKGLTPDPAGPDGDTEAMMLVLEALRRHDEFQLARAMVPDGSVFEAVGVRPTRPEDETDPAFLRKVWSLASSGTPPETCETSVRADAYRVRRLYSLWLEQGALRPGPGRDA